MEGNDSPGNTKKTGLWIEEGKKLRIWSPYEKRKVLTASSIQSRWGRLSGVASWDKSGIYFLRLTARSTLGMIKLNKKSFFKRVFGRRVPPPPLLCQSGLKVMVYRTNVWTFTSINESCESLRALIPSVWALFLYLCTRDVWSNISH